MKRFNFNIKDRKILFVILFSMIVSIFTLSMAYAALNAVLNISGKAEVASANWDIHFDNVTYTGKDNEPEITSSTSITFNPVLNLPGDKYFFTVDVVNDGTIDAMIESIEKKPELTSEQAKYIKYELSYANGDSIETNQLVEAGKFVRIKVTVEYRNDINVSDLPTMQNTLNLSIKLIYSQNNGEGSVVNNYGTGIFEIVNITEDELGSEVCLGEECFYVIAGIPSDEEDYVNLILLAKYNLYVGNEVTYFDSSSLSGSGSIYQPLKNPVVKQDSRALGAVDVLDENGERDYRAPFYGTIPFSDTVFWDDSLDMTQLYYEDNYIYPYLEKYQSYLIELGYDVPEIAIPDSEIVGGLKCNLDKCDYEFMNSTSYWIATSISDYMLGVAKGGGVAFADPSNPVIFGIRPIILYRVYE